MVARGEISRFWSLESLHLGTCAKCELHICLCYRLPVSLLAAHSASSPLLLIRCKCVCVCVCKFIGPIWGPERSSRCGHSKAEKLGLVMAQPLV